MKKVNIGGQAVMEGVMMKNQDKYAVAVRKPNNEIDVKVEDYVSKGSTVKLFKLPIIRGVVNFIESMIIGTKTLSYSSSFYEEEEEKTKFDKAAEKIFKDKTESVYTAFSLIISLVIAVAVFMLAPAWFIGLFSEKLNNSFLVALVEGVLRLAIFFVYILLCSLLKEIRRVYMYHGAEHKTINCLEAGEELTVENVKKYSRFNKRCGTSFVFVVMIISILFFMFISTDIIALRLVLRLLLVPVIAGVSYEFIRLAGKSNSKIIDLLSKPGLQLQRMTTREPDDDMIEVAIKSVEGVLDWKEYVKAVKNNEIEQ